ncbi:hypothetical protein [Zhihengliuella halotolerans]|uniref:hypothetical protein n=1 Tax=Zhihengliuella halotolerans TaxID=370736 RepID=UPI0011AF5E0F|nr:hypothetical protein [Zhihengliuella halotolerans]
MAAAVIAGVYAYRQVQETRNATKKQWEAVQKQIAHAETLQLERAQLEALSLYLETLSEFMVKSTNTDWGEHVLLASKVMVRLTAWGSMVAVDSPPVFEDVKVYVDKFKLAADKAKGMVNTDAPLNHALLKSRLEALHTSYGNHSATLYAWQLDKSRRNDLERGLKTGIDYLDVKFGKIVALPDR